MPWGSNLMPQAPGPPLRSEPATEVGWRPAVDVYSCHGGWLVKFDLAGVRPQDLDIRVNQQTLTVSGVRRDWAMELADRYYSMEISYHRFQRSVDLPENLEHAAVSADYRDGMLLVHLEWKNTP